MRHELPTMVLATLLVASGPARAAVDITANQIGRLTSTGNGLTRTFRQYDTQGRTVATQYVQDGQSRIVTMAYGYPQNPQSAVGPGLVMVRQTFPDGEQVTFTHDASGLEVTLRSALGAPSQDVVRDLRTNARGDVTRIELGNGTVTTRSYDDQGRLILTTTVNASGQKVQEYGYTYDGNGNVTGTTDGVRLDQSATYGYDSLDQLNAIRNASGSVIEQYVYDGIGNLTQKGALVQTYGAGGRPHALATSGGVTYGYDPNGNVVSIGGSTALEWNARNMATRVTAGPVVTQKSFVGELLWKKVENGVTTYYIPAMRLENGVARKYYGTFAERLEQPGDRQLRFYHPDHLGSSSVMTDQSGAVIRRASYFPWGQERGVDGPFIPKLQFNFKEKDANGFYDYGARLYNPVTGRWLSPDDSLIDGLNRYAYVGNNPWSLVDPTGHQSQEPQDPCGSDGKDCAPEVIKIDIWQKKDKEIHQAKPIVSDVKDDCQFFWKCDTVGRHTIFPSSNLTPGPLPYPRSYYDTHVILYNDGTAESFVVRNDRGDAVEMIRDPTMITPAGIGRGLLLRGAWRASAKTATKFAAKKIGSSGNMTTAAFSFARKKAVVMAERSFGPVTPRVSVVQIVRGKVIPRPTRKKEEK